MKKRRGSTLMFVVAVFAVFMIIGMSVTTLTLQNIKHSVIQKQRMETYYLMLSGLEIGKTVVMDATEPDPADMIYPAYKVVTFPKETQEVWVCDNDNPVVKLPLDLYGDSPLHDSHEICRLVTIHIEVTDSTGTTSPPSVDEAFVQIYAQAEWMPRGGAITRHAGTVRMWTVNPARQFREIADFEV